MNSSFNLAGQVDSPWLAGVSPGWCSNWHQEEGDGEYHWTGLGAEQCWQHCTEDTECQQAVHETNTTSGKVETENIGGPASGLGGDVV